MQRKKALAALLSVGVLGGLAASAAAMAQPGARAATARTTVEVAGTADAAGSADTGMPDAAAGNAGNDLADVRRGHVRVFLNDVHGRRTAQVDIVALDRGGNQVSVYAWNLTRGFHAIHIHAIGICDPAGAKPFASAGGHFNPTGQPEGMQAGAFPVLLAGANGEARTQFVDSNFRIRDIVTATGTAIVIHAAADNYANIPNRYTATGVPGPDAETQTTGDAGTRIACGVLSAPQVKPSGSPAPSPSMSGMAHM